MTITGSGTTLLEPTVTNRMIAFASTLVLLVVLIVVLIENLLPVGLATVKVRRK
jgi:hypothetical protein